MVGRYKSILVILLSCLSVLPLALRAQGYQMADGRQYHASSIYYVILKNAAGENINSLYAAVDGAIGAFVGSELRGASEWMPTGNTSGKGVFFIRVWGDENDSATATFRLRDSNGLEYQIASQDFSKGEEGSYGSPSSPISFTVVPVTGITLPATEITMKVGETYSLQTSLTPENHSMLLTTLSYTYTSSSAAFTVSTTGVISAGAIGQGKVTVKATPGNFTVEATVKVEAAPEKISVKEIRNNMASDQIEMTEGDELLLDFSVLPENATNKAVKFTNDYDIVGIKQETETSPVTIVAKKAGTDVLTVISEDNEKATLTYYITVKQKVIPVTKIEVTPSTLNAYVGETYDYTVKVLPENATDKSLDVVVQKTSVIDLDADNMKVTGKAVGTSKVTFRAKDGSGTEAVMEVKVSAVPQVTLSFATQTLNASRRNDVALTLTKEGDADFLPSRVELVFSKAANGEPSAIATKADESGLKWNVRGAYVGKHSVKIRYNGKEQAATCQVNVSADYPLQAGWNWLSLYAVSSKQGSSIPLTKEFLSGCVVDNANLIVEMRSQEKTLFYDPKEGYFGSLTKLTPTEGMYKVKAAFQEENEDKFIITVGGADLVSSTSLTLPKVGKGYTWVTYPHEMDHSIDALSKYLSQNVVENDMIIGQNGFAEYDGEKWITSNAFKLEAGQGYIYYTEGENERSLNWGPATLSPDAEPVRAAESPSLLSEVSAIPRQHADCMAVVARLDGVANVENYCVKAFVGNEYRGGGELAANGLLYITVNGEPGEKVCFRLFNKTTEQLEGAPSATVAFSGKAGSHSNPVSITGIAGNTAPQLATTAVYDLIGRSVGNNPAKGVYIESVTESGRRITRKIIRK